MGCRHEGADWVSGRPVLDLAAVGVASAEAGPAVSVGLASWLLEQITADERTVHAAGPVRVGWAASRRADGSMRYTSPVAESVDDTWVTGGHRFTVKEPVLVVFDPVERRAELAAKRRIVERYRLIRADSITNGLIGDVCEEYESEILPRLAESYAQRAGYRAEWAS